MERQRIGQAAECEALEFLKARGVRILLHNFRLRLGELDIVARDGDTLIIVEVRKRSSNRFGGAAASVGFRKQARLRRTAALLLQQRKDLTSLRVRFDVIAISPAGIEWIKHAFI
jgi:putative endonuclease